MTDPDTIASAVLNHIDLNQSPTDDDVFDGVPTTPISDVPTAPMRIPNDTIPNPFVGDENWEEDVDEDVDEDAVTVVRRVPALRARPIDPTGCMM